MKKYLLAILLSIGFFTYSQDLPKVTVQKLKKTDSFDRLFYGARVEPNLVYKQYAPITGTITEIFKKVGSYVKKDTEILTITRKSSGGVAYNLTYVRALSDGVITSMNLFEGLEVIEKQELFSLARITSYKVILLVSDRDIPYMKVGAVCAIKGEDKLTGKISQVAIIPNPQTGLFEVEITFPNYKELFIGKYIEVETRVNQIKGILIAQNQVTRKYGKTFLLVVKNDVVDMREITLGKVVGSDVIIASGVEEGEEFVATTNRTLNPGDKVVVVREESRANKETKR
jgi:multidrug efflux pump subunit AcrA (membrane-fusion protein)